MHAIPDAGENPIGILWKAVGAERLRIITGLLLKPRRREGGCMHPSDDIPTPDADPFELQAGVHGGQRRFVNITPPMTIAAPA